MVRAKFELVEEHAFSGFGGKKLIFQPRYDPEIPEDVRFSRATPSGNFEMHVDNPAALAQLKLGEKYYVDFTVAPDGVK